MSWTDNLQVTTKYLFDAPMMALQAWPLWVGFAGLEYFSDWAQTTAIASVQDLTYKRMIGAVTRGGILATNLIYFDSAWNGSEMNPV